MTVLATPLLEVVGSLCTALLAIGLGRLIELEAILGSLFISTCAQNVGAVVAGHDRKRVLFRLPL